MNVSSQWYNNFQLRKDSQGLICWECPPVEIVYPNGEETEKIPPPDLDE